MFCTKCGTNNEDTNAYCKSCGAKLVKPATNNAGSSRETQTHAPVNIMLMAGGAVVVIAILVVVYLKFANAKIGEEDFLSVDGSSSEFTYYVSDEDMYAISSREDADNVFKSNTDETGATVNEQKMPEESVYTSASGVSTLAGAKLLKEQTRAQNKEALLEIIQSEDLTQEAEKEAISSMIALAEEAQNESDTQMLLEAKGFTQTVVSINGESVDVIVEAESLTESQTTQIIDIVQRRTGIVAENIIITMVNDEALEDVQVSGVATIADVKLLKEQSRAQYKEPFNEILQNAVLFEENQRKVFSIMMAFSETARKESDTERLLEAKGFTAVVSISGEKVDVVVEAENLTESQTAQIINIVQRHTDIAPENIIITIVSASDE